MSATETRARTGDEIVEAARSLAPTIAARAGEIEAGRRVPKDLLDELVAAGCLGVLRPRSHGGSECDLATASTLLQELARADASTAWVTLIGGGTWFDVAGLSRESFDALYETNPDAIGAGAFNPTGMAVAVDGGFRITGRWAFASGCEHADWLYGNCVDTSSGAPQLRIAVFRRDEVEIEDTWHVSGLRGTGSHHISVHDVVVPEERTHLALEEHHCVDVTVLHIPVPATFAMGIASVALGTAQGALDDITALAAGKTPMLSPSTLAADPHFHLQLGRAEVQLRAARTLLLAEADAAWATAEARQEFTLEQRAALRSTAVFAVENAADVVAAAYRAGGGSSLYDDSPLQRRLRDVNAIAQHFLVKPDTLVTCGAILAGQQPELMVF